MCFVALIHNEISNMHQQTCNGTTYVFIPTVYLVCLEKVKT